ncbi:MAG: hypothetical protein H2174_09810 [Vampirovibrio sp.]|nr:hypothetical protein [Vampirovibrio sp.]
MQLSALSFAPNLLQNKPVGAQTTLASVQLTSSKADSFTPSAKIRQGNIEEGIIVGTEEVLSKGLEATGTVIKNLAEVKSNMLPETIGSAKHNLSAPVVDLKDPVVAKFLRIITQDEQY